VVPTLCLPLHHRNPAPDTQTHLYNIVITQHQRHISPLRVQRHQSAERPILRQTSSLMYPKIQQRQVIMNVLHPGSARPPRWLVASSSPEEVRARAVNSSVNFFHRSTLSDTRRNVMEHNKPRTISACDSQFLTNRTR